MAIRPGLGYGGLYVQPFLDADGDVSTQWYDFLQSLAARANTSGNVSSAGGGVPAVITAGPGVTVTEGAGKLTISAGGSGSVAYMPLTLGDQPPTFVTDGAGRLIMVAFAP